MSPTQRSVALVQLPILSPDPEVARANVPLAAGSLKAAALHCPGVTVSIPPAELLDHGGEVCLLDWLEAGEFDLVGFTTYLWNLERSLWLARQLKQRRPGTRVLFGGPEIVSGQPVLANPIVDAFVLGEGEPAFLHVLGDLTDGRELEHLYRGERLADLSTLDNPYLSGTLGIRRDRPIYLETMRGCPYRCSYCFYGKQYPAVRSYPEGVLPQLFARAQAEGAPEIYFMDPSFNATVGLEGRLERIARLNRTRIPLHTEIRLESVTPRVASLLAEAGFASVEVGLQSTNPRALRAIRRHWNRERFLNGAELLRRHGLEVRVGIILGLPWDGLDELDATLGFLLDHELTSGLEVYPLALLPGTELRDRAGDLGIRFMDLPPYWATSTNSLTEEQMLQAVDVIEERLEAELFPPIVPRFAEPPGAPGQPTGYLDLRDPREVLRRLEAPPLLETSVTVHLLGAQLGQASQLASLEELAARLRGTHPFSLFQIVVEAEEIPSWEAARRVAERFGAPGHIFERSRSLQRDLQGSFSARLIHLTGSPDVARRYYEEPVPFDLLLRYPRGLSSSDPGFLAEHPMLLLGPEVPPAEREALRPLYAGHEKLLVEPGPPHTGD
ncbi:MAG: radical SAM protein [Spirochaetales bacterium]|nr:radical SAM protein [Spirochaetales bacterium]